MNHGRPTSSMIESGEGFDRPTFSPNKEGLNQIIRLIRDNDAERGIRSAAGRSPVRPWIAYKS